MLTKYSTKSQAQVLIMNVTLTTVYNYEEFRTHHFLEVTLFYLKNGLIFNYLFICSCVYFNVCFLSFVCGGTSSYSPYNYLRCLSHY